MEPLYCLILLLVGVHIVENEEVVVDQVMVYDSGEMVVLYFGVEE